MGVIAIIATLKSAVDLVKMVKEVKNLILPPPPTDLKKKHRWFQCTIKNQTQFDLLYENTYFNSGKWWTAPGGTGSFTQMTFSGCNDDRAPAGVTLGCTLKIKLDQEHTFPIALGLTSPAAGSYKAGCIESESAQDGYNSAQQGGGAFTSTNKYQSTDEDGNETQIEFHVSAQPGPEMLVVITQVRL